MIQSRVGQEIAGKYRVVRLLGKGGMGAVYEAQHTVIGRRFAIKFLHQALTESPESLARFRREAQAAGSLESENIAAVTDFGSAEDGTPYIVMEYLTGEDLSRLLTREGPMPVPRVVDVVIQACRGLHAAHDAGIVHRDLKPENLFIARRGDGSDLVKVLDFGIAKLRKPEADGSATRTGTTIGTPFYMPPEQARGEKDIDHRADVYALGVILYEALSGAKPHPGDSYNEILYHILSRPPAPLESLRPGLPTGLAAIVHRALAFEANDRFANVAELTDALVPYAGRAVTPIQSRNVAGTTPSSDATTVETPPSVVSDPGSAEMHSLRWDAMPLVPAQDRSARLLAGLMLVVVVVGAGVVLTSRKNDNDAAAVASASAAPIMAAASVISAPSARALGSQEPPPASSQASPPASTPQTVPRVAIGRPAASGTPRTRPPSERRPVAAVAAPSSQAPAKKKPSLDSLIDNRR